MSNNLRFNLHRLDVSCKKIMCCGRTIFVCKEEMMLNKIARLGALAFRTNARFLIVSGACSPNVYKSFGARACRSEKIHDTLKNSQVCAYFIFVGARPASNIKLE